MNARGRKGRFRRHGHRLGTRGSIRQGGGTGVSVGEGTHAPIVGSLDPAVDEAREHLCALSEARRLLPSRRDHWAMPPLQKTRLELDQLAVDSTGKTGALGDQGSVRGGADGLLRSVPASANVWEWHRALNTVRSSVQELLDARMGLGLSPPDVPPITGTLRAVIAFGEDSRSTEVKRRYCEVLGIANRFYPPTFLRSKRGVSRAGSRCRCRSPGRLPRRARSAIRRTAFRRSRQIRGEVNVHRI